MTVMTETKVTFGVDAYVVFEMGMKGCPLPSGVQVPLGQLDNTKVVITCTAQEARAMAAWAARQAAKSIDYQGVVKLINLTLRLKGGGA
jgi:hypothetical protein